MFNLRTNLFRGEGVSMSSREARSSASKRSDGVSFAHPDIIYVNGKFLTVDVRFSVASAVAVRDGRFVAVGEIEDIKALAGPSTTLVDLQGQTVLPGLIDTHAHVERAGLLKYTVQLNDVSTVAQALARITEHASRTPKGRWIRGAQWHPVSQLAEKRVLTREDLDKAA